MIKLLKKDRIPFLKILLFGVWPSFLKVLFYRLNGYNIGKNVSIGCFSIILAKKIIIEDNVKIAPFTIIRGENVRLNRHSSIGSFCFIDTPKIVVGSDTRIRESVTAGGNKSLKSELKIGTKCLILQNSVLNTTDSINIGNNTAIGGGSKLFTHSSWLSILDGYPVDQGPISIGNNVWLPYDTTVLSNVSIGNDVIIIPKTVVNMNIPDKSIAGGYPIKIKSNFYKRELKEKQKDNVFKLMIQDLGNIIESEGFEKTNSENLLVLKKKKLVYLLTSDLSKLVSSSSQYTQYKSVFILFSDNKTDMSLQLNKKSSLVYLLNNIPMVINPNH
jgi:acetyltransferase-like isoleucine patch superfamily enzyme